MFFQKKSSGFTLIEMLVTVALMAVMAVVCWRGLNWVAAQRDAAEREGAELASLVRTFAQLERDFAERLPDAALPPRAAAAELPLAVGVSLTKEGVTELEILRFLPQAGGQPRALRVLYRIGASGLLRTTSSLDGSETPTSEVLLLPGAAALEVRAHAGGFWIEPGGGGQPGVQPAARAAAIEIAVGDATGARYVKVLIL